MITELERKFYDTFGIEPLEYICTNVPYEDLQYECTDGDYNKCKICKHVSIQYPDITAEKLLEMICICSTVYPLTINFKETIDELKEFILDFCIRHNTELGIEQIKSLFIRGDNQCQK